MVVLCLIIAQSLYLVHRIAYPLPPLANYPFPFARSVDAHYQISLTSLTPALLLPTQHFFLHCSLLLCPTHPHHESRLLHPPPLPLPHPSPTQFVIACAPTFPQYSTPTPHNVPIPSISSHKPSFYANTRKKGHNTNSYSFQGLHFRGNDTTLL